MEKKIFIEDTDINNKNLKDEEIKNEILENTQLENNTENIKNIEDELNFLNVDLTTDKDFVKQQLEILISYGCHFGHSFIHPSMKKNEFIIENKKTNGCYIIDLYKTLLQFQRSLQLIEQIISNGKKILVISTCNDEISKNIMQNFASICGLMFIRDRFQPGTITNFSHFYQKKINLDQSKKKFFKTKKEEKIFKKRILKTQDYYSELRDFNKPSLIIVLADHCKKNYNIILEAKSMDIPVIQLADLNVSCNDFTRNIVVCNTKSIDSIKYFCEHMSKVILKSYENFIKNNSNNNSNNNFNNNSNIKNNNFNYMKKMNLEKKIINQSFSKMQK